MKTEIYAATKCPECGNLHYNPEEKGVPSVRCAICGKLHDQESHTYVAVAGNITKGVNRGIIGNNIENDIVTKVSIFCAGKCFESVCTGILPEKSSLVCPKGGVIKDDFVDCGRKPDCQEKHPKEYQKCRELSE